jgi:hypothetical protein
MKFSVASSESRYLARRIFHLNLGHIAAGAPPYVRSMRHQEQPAQPILSSGVSGTKDSTVRERKALAHRLPFYPVAADPCFVAVNY